MQEVLEQCNDNVRTAKRNAKFTVLYIPWYFRVNHLSTFLHELLFNYTLSRHLRLQHTRVCGARKRVMGGEKRKKESYVNRRTVINEQKMK